MPTTAPTPGTYPVLAAPVPPAEPLSFPQYVRASRRNFLETIHEAIYREGIVERHAFGVHSYIVNDPAGLRRVLLDNVQNYPKADIEHRVLGPALGNGLLLSEGETWRAHRRIMAPSFDTRFVARCSTIMTDVAVKLAEEWQRLPEGTVIEVEQVMMDVTMEIISRSMFSRDSDAVVGIVRHGSERYQRAMMVTALDFAPYFGPAWGWLKGIRGRAIMKRFDGAFARVLEARKRNPPDPPVGDLLEKLIVQRDEQTGIAMTAREIRDQVLTIFVAGHETTAIALMWTWYVLSQFPEHEARLHEELRQVLGGRAPLAEDIARLPFTRMVLQETMRLYPPAYSMAFRQAVKADVLCGRPVPKGSMITIMPWVLHRHRSYWEEPERFDPERFANGTNALKERMAYLPFGWGPHVCIGASFSMNEATLVLATLAQRFRLRVAPGHVVEPVALFTLHARYGMKMVLEKR